MQIEQISIIKGPSIWSSRRTELVQMRLNLEKYEALPTNLIEGFYDRMVATLPSLYKHRCSEGVEGGFLSRVKDGTWMGHVIEHFALELQTLAGMFTGFGRTRGTGEEGIYFVVFSYVDPEVGVLAAELAVELALSLSTNQDVNVEEMVTSLRDIAIKNQLGPSTQNIVDAAVARGIPWRRLTSNTSEIAFGYGIHQRKIQATLTDRTSYQGVCLVGNKHRTKALLQENQIPIPLGGLANNLEEAQTLAKNYGFPLVIKPLDGNQGKGATIQITQPEEIEKAFILASNYSTPVIVERYIPGFDFRLLVINHQLIAAAQRLPAQVIGDGMHTVEELIAIENHHPQRGEGHSKSLTKITVDQDLLQQLEKQNLTLQSIPLSQQQVRLKSTCNLSTGGTSINVTDQVHPQVRWLAEKISRLVGLDICGIDIMAKDLTQPLSSKNGAVLEVNASPGFRMHTQPSEGESLPIGNKVMDYLYPKNTTSQIPIIAVTGTNGKTTTTRLIAHLLNQTGKTVGFTTTDGIYVGNHLVEKGDTTGPRSAKKILYDPMVEVAVLETARGGILREGLAFKQCTTGVLTNIEEDHLGLNGVHTLADLARVKKVVLDAIIPEGWAIINANNVMSMEVSLDLICKKAYFILEAPHDLLETFEKDHSPYCTVIAGRVTLFDGQSSHDLMEVESIPITYEGTAHFMVENVLTATLTAFLNGVSLEQLKQGLKTFFPSVEQTPGRLNLFEVNDYQLLVDYAHNPSGYEAVRQFIQYLPATRKIGIISGIGDRRDEDIIACASIAAEMFDVIIIRQEHHLRGRTEKEITQLLLQGIQTVSPDIPIQLISNEVEALEYALQMAEKGDLVVALSDEVSNVLHCIDHYLKKVQSIA